MEEIRVIIADDDQASKTLLCYFVELLSEYKVVGNVTNGPELIQLVKEENPHIILVDIHMPGINGVEAAKLCKEINPALQVIFTTGSDEYAVEAFSISAADYIVKPIEKVRLFVALEKAKQSIQLLESKGTVSKNKLAIKSSNAFFYILIKDILYIEKVGRKTIIHTENMQYETLESLQEIEERLPGHFFKTHRSYLVNLRKIVKIESLGETYAAYFENSDEKAFISKLKINEVYRCMEI
ncbi:LytTR family DNA-binding domain-containing protein [Neobacillus sp. 114]|uniref:LytR/AlgR family response regulator transcription factor n=1 Tax=Neobacillus sp. 114 TaxID=3048535 RepID=UPI0024C459C3|nr:LytTR family DNA-binding domain-containing protein [Neobacillus sp. 114]